MTAWDDRRRRRAHWLMVAIPVCVAGAAVVSFFIVPSRPDDVLLTRPVRGAEAAVRIDATFRNFDAATGSVQLNANFQPLGELAGPSGPTTEVHVLVLGASNGALTFREGEAMAPATLTVPITGSRVTRYPFDRYRNRLVIAAGDEDGEAIPVVLNLSANLNDFSTSAEVSAATARSDGVDVTTRFARNGAVLLWSGTLSLLCWALATGAVMIGWLVLVYHQPVPIWSWGYLPGILFALPNLRNGLPGSPPFGSLVDWAAFYWAIGITGLVLFVLLSAWFRRQRHAIAETARAAEAAAEATGEHAAVSTAPRD